MEILLVNPAIEGSLYDESRLPPLGLAYVASVLRSARHGARLIDASVSNNPLQEILQAVNAYRPEIVGFSVLSPALRISLRIAAAIRAAHKRPRIIMGGVHPSVLPAEVVGNECVDYVVHGEGEWTVPELIQAIQSGQQPDDIAGIAYKRENAVRVTARRPLIKDLDTIPFPAYDLLPLSKYSHPQIAARPLVSMITSRGCPHRCIFCDAHVVHGRRYRAHSPERVLDEIEYLKRRFRVGGIIFKDSEFTLDHNRVEKICDLLMERGLKLEWSCNSRIDSTSPALLRKMRKAGCGLIQYGVEAGDQEVLDRLRKQITIEQVKETFRITKEAGLKTHACFTIGNPGETAESIERTIRLSEELGADYAAFFFLTPYPGTELDEMAKENGWLPAGADREDLRPDTCVMNATRLDAQQLRQMHKKAYRSFYLRPSYLARRAFTLNAHEWKMNLKGLAKIVGI